MGSGTLPTRADLDVMDEDWWNDFQNAIKGDFPPRNSSAVATDLAANIGSESLRFKRAQIASGHFSLGDLKWRHSYNGLLPVGEGWMLCDGREVNEENYDAEHGAGAWQAHIGSSPLQDKFLPNLVNRYAIGAAATTQDGDVAITPVGNTTHIADLSHNHQWYDNSGNAATVDSLYDSSGNAKAFSSISIGDKTLNTPGFLSARNASAESPFQDAYSDKKLSATTNLQPESIEAIPYMRII